MARNIKDLLEHSAFVYHLFHNEQLQLVNELNAICFKPNVTCKEYHINVILVQMMLMILQNFSFCANQPKHSSYKALEACIAYIHQHYNENIGLREIASYANISIGHCGYLFKQLLQTSPYEYLIDYRLKKSLELLPKQTNITAIALSCGFPSSSNYINHFKQKLHLTPKQYQKQLKTMITQDHSVHDI